MVHVSMLPGIIYQNIRAELSNAPRVHVIGRPGTYSEFKTAGLQHRQRTGRLDTVKIRIRIIYIIEPGWLRLVCVALNKAVHLYCDVPIIAQ